MEKVTYTQGQARPHVTCWDPRLDEGCDGPLNRLWAPPPPPDLQRCRGQDCPPTRMGKASGILTDEHQAHNTQKERDFASWWADMTTHRC